MFAGRSPTGSILAAVLAAILIGVLIGVAAAILPARACAAAEVLIGPVAGGLTIDGEVGEWLTKPPSLLLQPTSGSARAGRVWLGESAEGLIVAGRVGGPPPRFVAKAEPGANNPVLSDPAGTDRIGGDRVELALALGDDLPLPKIGWTEASGPVALDGPADCARLEALADDANAVADCETWMREQLAYRRQFLNLFARRWRLAPGVTEEVLAGPAFAALPITARDELKPLAPKGAPVARFRMTESGYSFEILVPWEALPPSPALELSRLRLAIDAVTAEPGGESLAAAAGRPRAELKAAEVKSMTLGRLEPPRRWRLSRCDYPLAGFDSAGTAPATAVFLPTSGAEVDTIFIIENPLAAKGPATAGFSPGITSMTFFSQALAPEVTACGPPLAIRRGATVTFVPDALVSRGLKVHPVKGGWLVADGPYTGEAGRYANDECAGCSMISLRVFFIASAGGDAVTAFDDAWLIDDVEAAAPSGRTARVALRPDLGLIDAYEADISEERGRLEWTRVRHCYDADAPAFRECGRWPKTPPPAALPIPPEPPS